jgi:hypothetical protein
MYCCRQFNRELDRPVVHDGCKFQLGRLHFSPLVRLQHQIPRDHYANRKTRPDRQGRLDVQIAPNHLLAGLVQGIPCPTAQCLNDGAVAVACIRAGSELCSYSKQGGKQRRLDSSPQC